MPIYASELETGAPSPNQTPDCLRLAATIVKQNPGAEIWWVETAGHYYVLFSDEDRVGNLIPHVPRLSADEIRSEGKRTELSDAEMKQLLG